MNQSPAQFEWIDEYLDWSTTAGRSHDSRASSRYLRSSTTESVAAYLEWMDVERTGSYSLPAASLSSNETDRRHTRRRALDAGKTAVNTLQLASEALDNLRRLVETERGAWTALRRQVDSASHNDNWPDALEGVAADLHALTGKVQALQAYQHR